MANDILFAPQVESVQPAFIYNKEKETGGSVTITFSLSDYNKNLNLFEVNYVIRDGNRSSKWGNDIVKSGTATNISLNNNKYSFKIEFTKEEELTVNQYYQVQLQLVQGNNKSSWSQVTLIRPIPPIESKELNVSNSMLTFDNLSGEIKYKDDTTIEGIKNYYFTLTLVQENADDIEMYKSDMYYNNGGTSFFTKVNNCFVPDGIYTLTVYFTTVHAYKDIITNNINIGVGNLDYSSIEFSQDIKEDNSVIHYPVFSSDFNSGALNIDFKISNAEGNIIIQRTDDTSNFLYWNSLNSFRVNMNELVRYTDFNVEANKIYKYRFILISDKNYLIRSQETHETTFEYIADFEDIFLSDTNQQLAIRFNPSITGFKYVSQESITNTLGGKFPIVRINGDTKYRQFNLSGTLSFESDYWNLDSKSTLDSRGINIDRWINNNTASYFFNINDFYNSINSFLKESAIKNNKFALERKFRDLAIAFLNNRKPKVFRSPTEGNMIVYLSNVSFTPNKQLSRNIYDFSATVTEICEFNYNNLEKYGLLYKPNETYKLSFALSAYNIDTIIKNGITYVVPYISYQDTIDGIPVIQADWTKIGG